MQLHSSIRLLCATLLLSPALVCAQDAAATSSAATPSPAAVCEARAGAPAWVPCGPDRTLTEDEVRNLVLKEKDGTVVKITGTSGTSGKNFFINLLPGGKLESGLVGGRNWGKSWKFEGGKLCRDYYAPSTDRHCGVFEVSGGNLYLFDAGDVKKSHLMAIEYAKP